MLSENWRPKKDESGTYVFAVPLGDGTVPVIHLEDLGLYCCWIFDNPVESKGINLEVADNSCRLGRPRAEVSRSYRKASKSSALDP